MADPAEVMCKMVRPVKHDAIESIAPLVLCTAPITAQDLRRREGLLDVLNT